MKLCCWPVVTLPFKWYNKFVLPRESNFSLFWCSFVGVTASPRMSPWDCFWRWRYGRTGRFLLLMEAPFTLLWLFHLHFSVRESVGCSSPPYRGSSRINAQCYSRSHKSLALFASTQLSCTSENTDRHLRPAHLHVRRVYRLVRDSFGIFAYKHPAR